MISLIIFKYNVQNKCKEKPSTGNHNHRNNNYYHHHRCHNKTCQNIFTVATVTSNIGLQVFIYASYIKKNNLSNNTEAIKSRKIGLYATPKDKERF